jgi:tRNA (guanosine-2'-O-)-methyltransferase
MSAELVNYLSGFVNARRLQKFEKVLENRTRYITLVCEDIYQGHNASALLRTCDCFGIQDFHIIEKRNVFDVNPEIALGASNWLTIFRDKNPDNDFATCLTRLRSKGYRIVATTPDRESISLSDLDLKKGPLALMFGTEKDGLSEDILKNADEFVGIEMFGFSGSFNVSVSAGIILYHLRMKLNQGDIGWQLSNEEKMVIRLDWLRKSIRSSELIERDFYRKSGES